MNIGKPKQRSEGIMIMPFLGRVDETKLRTKKQGQIPIRLIIQVKKKGIEFIEI